MNDSKDRLGRVAYEKYADGRHGLAYDGKRIPDWEQVRPGIREAWIAAALQVARTAVNDHTLASQFQTHDSVDRVLEVARSDIGRTDADTFRVGRGGGNWCAYWLSSVLERAGLPTPKPNERARRGARALTRWVAKNGRWVIAPDDAKALTRRNERRDWLACAEKIQPGDIIAWRATLDPLDWRGHVAMVEAVDRKRGSITTIGGNERGAVRNTEWPLDEWPWRRRGGLYCVARQ